MSNPNNITEDQAREEVHKYANRVSADDVSSTVNKEDKFQLLFKSVEKLSQYWDDVKLVFEMLKDYTTGRYTKCPWRTIAVLVGALAYVLSPLDLLPDFIPLIGWTDDCMVLAGALSLAQADLEEYKKWKNS